MVKAIANPRIPKSYGDVATTPLIAGVVAGSNELNFEVP